MAAVHFAGAPGLAAAPQEGNDSRIAACNPETAQSRTAGKGQAEICEPESTSAPQGDPGSGNTDTNTQNDAGMPSKHPDSAGEEPPPQCKDPLYAEANPAICF